MRPKDMDNKRIGSPLTRHFRLLAFLMALAAAPAPAWDSLERTTPARPADEAAAYAWALGATLVPIAMGGYLANEDIAGGVAGLMIFAGALGGPSAGQFYAGSTSQGWGGIGLRAGGGLLMVAGIVEAIDDICFMGGAGEGCEGDGDDGTVLAVAGLMVAGAGTLYSLVDTHFAVRRNQAAWTAARLELAPVLALTGAGDMAYGTRLRFWF